VEVDERPLLEHLFGKRTLQIHDEAKHVIVVRALEEDVSSEQLIGGARNGPHVHWEVCTKNARAILKEKMSPKAGRQGHWLPTRQGLLGRLHQHMQSSARAAHRTAAQASPRARGKSAKPGTAL
jgi:hypothetical protein